jgi:hypothetical protein
MYSLGRDGLRRSPATALYSAPTNLLVRAAFAACPDRFKASTLAPEVHRGYDQLSVQAASLEVLDKAAVPPAQARAIVQAIEIEIAGAKDTLATKQDILILRHEMAELRTELKADMAELRTELKADMAELRIGFQVTMTSHVRHMYGAIMGQFALLLGLAYFFVSRVQR